MLFFKDICTQLTGKGISEVDIERIRECLTTIQFTERQTVMSVLYAHPEHAVFFADIIEKKKSLANCPNKIAAEEILTLEKEAIASCDIEK